MVSTKILLYKHKTLKNGTHPIVMQVLYNRKRKVVTLGFHAKTSEWSEKKSRFKRTVTDSQVKNSALQRFDLLAQKIVNDSILSGKPFSFTEFQRKFTGKQTESHDFFAFSQELIDEMLVAGKVGNRSVYVNVRNSLKHFVKGTLNFEDINVKFLNKYEVWLASEKYDRDGCGSASISQYMRTIRAIFNKAISREMIQPELYPFRNQFNPKGYSLSHLKSEPAYRALSVEELDKFKGFDVEKNKDLANPYHYFMFMYYCRGLNWTDLCHLKRMDIKNGRIYYTRKKTKKKFSIKISEPLQNILDQFDKSALYVFPILSSFHKTPTQKQNRIKKCLKQVNSDLKLIAMKLDIEPNLSTYSARHTYAMSLKRGGINMNIISDALGHADIQVTRHYLSRFEDEVIDAADMVL
ncbi:MAG: site-specific integrase [Bacteroidota bacterium]